MAWFNIIALFCCKKPALLALKDYENQRNGQRPCINPEDSLRQMPE
jgi:Na+/alanine symporter